MRNDLKDELLVVPSLTIDDVDPVSGEDFALRHRRKSKFSNGFVVFLLLLFFVIYSIGIGVLFWMFKQSTDDVREQLSQTTNSTTQSTASNLTRWQEVAKQLSDQQTMTKNSLESLRNQNKQLAAQLNKALTEQQSIVKQQSDYSSRLQKIDKQLQELGKSNEQVKQLASDITALNQSQNTIKSLTADVKALQDKKLPQTIQSVQDDLLLLRSQLDASTTNDSKQQLLKFEKQLQSLQSQVDTLKQQLANRSLY